MSTNKPARGAQFTPGPWVVECKKFIATPKAVVIAELNDGLQGEYPESGHINANATLIAAAPAMYEALQHAAMSYHHLSCKARGEYAAQPERYCTCHVQKARTALAQAEGRQG